MSTYNNLMDAGWRMQEIDCMDMLGYWKVRAWKANAERGEVNTPDGKIYLDDVW